MRVNAYRREVGIQGKALHNRRFQRRARHRGARPLRVRRPPSPTVALASGLVVLALLVLAATALGAAGAAPDPAPQSASAGAGTAGPAPDPTPQSAASSSVHSPAVPTTRQTEAPVSAAVSGAGPPVAEPNAAAVTRPTFTRTPQPSTRAAASAKHARSRKLAPRRRSPTAQARLHRVAPTRTHDLLDLPAVAISSPMTSHPSGALLLIGALALAVLALASSSLLRRLMRMNAELTDRGLP
jgi:hypothetical protein